MPNKRKVTGYLYNEAGEPLSNTIILIRLCHGVTAPPNILYSRLGIVSKTGANGYFEVYLVPNEETDDPNSYYEMTVPYVEGDLKLYLRVPSGTTEIDFRSCLISKPTTPQVDVVTGIAVASQALLHGNVYFEAGQNVTLTQDNALKKIIISATGGGGSTTNHNLLSATHTDTVAGTPARGDIIVAQLQADNTIKWQKKAIGSAGQYLRSDGTDVQWANIQDSDIPNTIVRTSRRINTGTGLTGGGDLSADRTIEVVPNTTVQKVEVAKAGTLISTRKRINLMEGTGISISVSDDATNDKTDITITATGSAEPGPHALLGASHNDTVAGIPSRGDIIVARLQADNTIKWQKMAIGSAGQYLRSDGTDVQWSSIQDADIPATIVRTSRCINTGTGLTGGGDLSVDRTLSVVNDTTVQKVEVEANGTLIGTRKRINLIAGTNVTISATDDATNNKVNVTISATGGGSGGGTPLPTVSGKWTSPSAGAIGYLWTYTPSTDQTMYIYVASVSPVSGMGYAEIGIYRSDGYWEWVTSSQFAKGSPLATVSLIYGYTYSIAIHDLTSMGGFEYAGFITFDIV